MIPKLENITKNETQYRLITVQFSLENGFRSYAQLGKMKYLQFKSERTVRGFPDMWNKYKQAVWRFIPKQRDIQNNYFEQSVYEENCPTSFDSSSSEHMISCPAGLEYDKVLGFTDFTKKFSDISDYFIYANKSRKKYLRQKKEIEKEVESKLVFGILYAD